MSQHIELTLQVTVSEGDMIVSALAALPFKDVANLIGKLQAQANPQLRAGLGSEEPVDPQIVE